MGRLMVRRLNNIPLTHRFFILGVLGIVLVILSTAAALKRTYDLAYEAKTREIKHLVEAASSTVQSYIDRAKSGELTSADAKRLALDALRAARFEGGNFFFLEQWDGVSLLTVPATKVGVNRIAETDVKGNHFIKEIIEVSKQPGGGFLTYWLPFPGQTEPDYKVSYVIGFPDWQWALGTGLFITSVNVSFRSAAWDLALIVMPLLALFGLILFGMARGVSKLLLDLTSSMKRTAAGDLDAEIPDQDRTDEIGQMAVTVAGFREAAREKQRLEREAEAQRNAAETEKRRAASLIQEAADTSRTVVDAIAKGLTQLSAGDLTSRIDDVFSAEYQKLRDDFNSTATSLQEAMSTITEAAAGISSGSDQIARATDDLSRRTEQQAANLEQTASALNGITGSVTAMAAGANEAAQVVATARGAAETSGVIVTKAVDAMGKIATSANQISNIIGVIDEIAFQTNLLALNAGVEAARAGDAGRGFAVVAAEVRALAQRSAEAAKEIKSLISASSAQVENGVDLVGKTGSALKDIIEKFASMETLVRQMSQSTQEQATGLVEINTAITQMDQAVQQNAAFVEESTAAAHTLMGDSRSLTTMINRFKTGAARAEPAEAPKPRQIASSSSAGRSPHKPAAPARPAVIVKSLNKVAGAAQAEHGWDEF